MPAIPSDAEFRILTLLWEHGPQTVRAVHEELAKGTGYTSTLKQMQVMQEKGLLKRREGARPHVYEAVIGKQEAQARFAGDVMHRLFEGSARNLVLGALAADRASTEELEQVRRMLDQLEQRKQRQ